MGSQNYGARTPFLTGFELKKNLSLLLRSLYKAREADKASRFFYQPATISNRGLPATSYMVKERIYT